MFFGSQRLANHSNIQLETLDLDFSKKNKCKSTAYYSSNTQRKQSAPIEPLNTDRSLLIQKKKNYSDAIRERNMHKTTRRKGDSVILQRNQINHSEQFFDSKQNIEIQAPKMHQRSTTVKNKQNIANKQSKKKLNLTTEICFEQIRSKGQDKSKRKLDLHSNVVCEKVIVLDSEATKLLKQNQTYKKDIVKYRKENNLLKKELKQTKNRLSQLECQTSNILDSSLCQLELNTSAEMESARLSNYDNEQLLHKLQQEINELRNTNGTLVLKAYMAQKKLLEQTSSFKKRMGASVQQWRQKCAKLRMENLKLKRQRQVTLSMQISKDQQ